MDGTVIVVTRPGLGTTGPGDEQFGREMLDKFFHTLEKHEPKPVAVCFYTEGVRCVAEGSPMLMGLRLLEGMGVRLVSCLTCLKHYGIEDKLAVGGVGGMDEIVDLLAGARKVITV
jgi:intracellular sulfur oxidation DsrE/DsrF family protein